MNLAGTQIKDTYGNLITIGSVAGTPTTGTLQNGAGSDLTAVTINGTGTVTTLVAGAGLVGTPAITTSGDLNTGLWFPAADTVAISTAGAERLRIDSSGNVGIGTTNIVGEGLIANGKSLSMPLTSDINANSTSSSVTSGSKLISLSGITGPSNYTAATMGIHQSGSAEGAGDFRFSTGDGAGNLTEHFRITNAGNVGIGTTSPTAKLDVVASPSFAGEFNGTNTYLDIVDSTVTGRLQTVSNVFNVGTVGAGDSFAIKTEGIERVRVANTGSVGIGTSLPTALLDVRGSAVFNEAGADVDFRVEGDTNTHLIFADASVDKVMIGSSSSGTGGRLEVVGGSIGISGIYGNGACKTIVGQFTTQPNTTATVTIDLGLGALVGGFQCHVGAYIAGAYGDGQLFFTGGGRFGTNTAQNDIHVIRNSTPDGDLTFGTPVHSGANNTITFTIVHGGAAGNTTSVIYLTVFGNGFTADPTITIS